MSNKKYNHKSIESKWQKKWEEDKLYKTCENKKKPKYYILDMFPYPSGAGLHVGHPKGYIATDIFARMKMMQGYNVLHPMGWDAFGLPAENFALKNKIHPRISTDKNIATFKSQLGKLGFSYDWEREINTTDPEFYKWTQWIFLQMFKKGLAYESHEPIIWCPSCKTGLAQEDLENGKCERCDSEVERKPMRQWVLRITDYAERMLNDLDKLPEWESSIKEMQKGWIGRSEGAIVKFPISNFQFPINFQNSNDKNLKSKNYFKFRGNSIEKIYSGQKWVTFRIEPKDVKKGDIVTIIDWADGDKKNQKEKGKAIITKVDKKRLKDLPLNYFGHEKYTTYEKMKSEFGKYYDEEIKNDSIVHIYEFAVENFEQKIFTTRPDTLFGATYFVMAPEHPLVKKITTQEQKSEVEKYIKFAGGKSELERTELAKEKTGVFTGSYAVNPVNGEEIPIWIADYVMMGYGTGAIMAVPAHDERDFEFAKKYNLPIRQVVQKINDKQTTIKNNPEVFTGEGININSDFSDEILSNTKTPEIGAFDGSEDCCPRREIQICQPVNSITDNKKDVKRNNDVEPTEGLEPSNHRLTNLDLHHAAGTSTPNLLYQENKDITKSLNGLKTKQAKEKIIEWLEKNGVGKKAINYKLKDWVFSRQRYWGEPIPIIHCEKCGAVGVPEKDLPVKLPEVEQYAPSGTGESPLATIPEWVNTTCPKCGGSGKRETNTMPQWAGSSWYYLRYIDPKNDKVLVDKKKEEYWSPVDFYVGGAEHATRHLIYARFWHKFLYDIGVVNYEEPFKKLRHVGLIMAEDGRKMSKRWGNVINPDDIVEKYGADAMRVYEMFMGPFSQSCAWSTSGLVGTRKFLEKIWGVKLKVKSKKLESNNLNMLHKTIKKVGDDIKEFKLNTAVSAMMILVNALEKEKEISQEVYEKLLLILSPFAPHITEELWGELSNKESIFKQKWPEYNPKLIKDEKIQLVVQINGKLRDTIEVDADISENDAKKVVLESEKIKKWTEGKKIIKIIFVKGKLVNVVVK